MNRTLALGIAIFLAVVGIALMGGQSQAVAGHGCHGCDGVADSDCCGRQKRDRCCGREKREKCHGRDRCNGREKCHGRDRCNGREKCHGRDRCSGREKCHGRDRCSGRKHRCCGCDGGGGGEAPTEADAPEAPSA